MAIRKEILEKATHDNPPKPSCYLCGKEIEPEDLMRAPVLESPGDAECPPKAPFHKKCYRQANFTEVD